MQHLSLPVRRGKRLLRVRFFLPLLLTFLILSLTPLPVSAAGEYVEKYWSEMTAEEKTAALQLLLSGENGFAVPTSVYAEGASRPLNEALWYSNGILVYGDSFGGTSAYGPRYWGYDINGGYYGNNAFPRDSDTGRPAYEKAWLTVEQIQENPVARGYVGELALDQSAFYLSEKRTTAELWLAENPAWTAAGIDTNYILAHFCFNSVISDTGLTTGQFIGVHRSIYDGNLYYQTFSVEAPLRLFLVPNEEYVPPEPDPDPDPDPEPDDPPAVTPESVIINANALITGPDTVYVGETVELTDRTSFSVDGVSYQTKSAYTTFHITSDWRTSSGFIWAKNETEAAAVFDTTGRKTVTLALGRTATYVKSDGTPVTATLSGTLTATKTLTVLPVPAADVSLSGPHKANRAERMVLNIHTHPNRPLSRIELTIYDETGATVLYRVVRNVSAGTESVSGYLLDEALPADVRVTDGRVKARALEKTLTAGNTAETWELPFLTKNGETKTYRYTVTVVDSGGYSGTSGGTFTQSRDAAPAAAISLADVFYRAETGNKASIEVTDATPSDGDAVERTWSFADTASLSGGVFPANAFRVLDETTDPALADRSFGTRKTVAFDKTGVGRFAVKLTARDVWTEETLSEFVTPADVMTGEAVATSEVANLAPRVSLSLSDSDPVLNCLFLTETEAEQTALEASFASLAAELRAGGLSPVLSARTISPPPSSAEAVEALSRPVSLVKTIVEKEYGYEGAWTFLNFAAAVDDYRLYTVTGTFVTHDIQDKPTAPYTIRAYDASSGALEWTYTLTDAVMDVATTGSWHVANTRIVTDLAGRYVFFRSGTGKTLVLDARTGTALTVLDYNIGGGVYATGDAIYFYRADGLWKIDARTGATTLIAEGTFLPKSGQSTSGANDTAPASSGGIGTAAALYRGRFVAIENRSGTICRTSFDPVTSAIARTELTTAKGTWTVLALDAAGNTVLHSSGLAKMVVFDESGTEIARVGTASNPTVCAAALDETGVCRYVSDGHTRYYSDYFGEGPMGEYRRYAYDLSTGKYATFTNADPTVLYPYSNNAILSVARDKTLYEAYGGYYSYVYNYGYSGYSERPIAIRFNFKTRTATTEAASLYGLDTFVELGGRSDGWLFARADDNSKTDSAAVTTRILAEPRTEDQVLALLEARNLRTDGALNVVLTADKADAATLLAMAADAGLIDGAETGDPAAPYVTLAVGEPVGFTISYSDPENDPSRESHWRYSYSDPSGTNASWVREYATPLTSFTQKGRYLLEHWQVDDTGDPAYDLESNVLRLLIYVTEGEAPEIPKDLTAGVHHTDEWERNRLRWNERYPDQQRAPNVFWAGERLVCVAAVEGDVRTVTAELKHADGSAVPPSSSATGTLAPTGGTDANGIPLYYVELWDASWIDAFGRDGPEPFIVTFTSTFADDSVLVEDVPILFDSRVSFFRVHRMW